MQKTTTTKLIRWLVIIAMPFFLGFTWITLVVSPAYPRWEYSKENFPRDLAFFNESQLAQTGLVPMTQAERLERALVAVAYLESWQSPDEVIWMLDEQTLPTGAKLFNQAEIQHMIDVKVLTDTIRILAIVTGLVVIGGVLFLLRDPATRLEAYRAIFQGGVTTTILLVGIAGFILLGWSVFFVQFHEMLFADGTWTFAYTDGLIRLYPEQFFFDVGIILSMGSLALGVLTAAVGYMLWRRGMGLTAVPPVQGSVVSNQ